MSLVQRNFFLLCRVIGTQNWVRWGIRYHVLQFLKNQNFSFAVPFFGYTYRGNLNNFIDRGVFFWGAHERETMLYMGKYIPKYSVVLDIGGNVGHHSLYFSTKAQEVHAFEPFPLVADVFERRIRENKITNIFLHRVGLGDNNKKETFYAPTGDNLGVGSFVASKNTDNKGIGTLAVVKGDDMVASLGLKRVDFIKIDTERYERYVLVGLKETIQKFKPAIILEFRPEEFKSEGDFLSLIPGYTPYILHANRKKYLFFNSPSVVLKPFQYNIGKTEVLLKPMHKT